MESTTRFTPAPAIAGLLLLLGIGSVTAQERDPGPEYLRSEATREADLPFSDAVRVGNMLYLSGAVGIRPGTLELVSGGIAAETRQTMENIRTVLQENGSSMDRVVRCTIMLADIDEWPQMNEVYTTFFDENLPARSAFGASGLALGARVEIECLATVME